MPFPCPYCSLPLTADRAASRVVCPRCGESAPVPADTAGDAVGPTPIADESPGPDDAARSLKSLALLGALIAVTVSAIGVYAFTRPSPDRRRPVVPPPAVAPASPLQWPGLTELPADCNAVFAARPGVAPDARERLRTAGVPDGLFTTLEQLGVRFEQLDAVAGGVVGAPGVLVPRTVIVVSLREPIDPAALRAKLKTRPAKQFGAHEFAVRGFPVFVRDAGPRSLTFATELTDLKPAPPRLVVPGDPAGQLPAGVRDAARKVPADSTAWAATAPADWPSFPPVAIGLKLLEKDPRRPAAERLARASAVWAAVPPAGVPEVWTRDAAGAWTQFGQ